MNVKRTRKYRCATRKCDECTSARGCAHTRAHARSTGAPTREAARAHHKERRNECACTTATQARLPAGSRWRYRRPRDDFRDVANRAERDTNRRSCRSFHQRSTLMPVLVPRECSISRKPPRRGIDGSSAWRLLRHRRTPPSPTANTTRQWRSTRWTSRFSSNKEILGTGDTGREASNMLSLFSLACNVLLCKLRSSRSLIKLDALRMNIV